MTSLHRRIFKKSKLQKQMQKEGFVKLRLLNSEEMKDLLRFYENEVKGFAKGDFLHTHMASEEIKLKVNHFVKPKMEQALSQVLYDYKVGLGYFMVKPRHGSEPMRVHQDKTLVDESKYVGLTVWCPLLDVNPSNGCLSVVRRSHLFLNNPRGSEFDMPYRSLENLVEGAEYSDLITVSAGEAMIFDHRLWHASTANSTSEDRIVVAAVAAPSDSYYVHYEVDASGNALNLYHAGDDFPIRFSVNKALPEGCKLVQTNIPMNPELSQSEFLKLYEKYNSGKQTNSIWKNMFRKLASSK